MLGGCVAASHALWVAVAICGIWLIVRHDHRLTEDQDIRMRLGYTTLFVVSVIVFGGLSRLAFRKASC
jgi:hypothetical protein